MEPNAATLAHLETISTEVTAGIHLSRVRIIDILAWMAVGQDRHWLATHAPALAIIAALLFPIVSDSASIALSTVRSISESPTLGA